MNRIWTQTKSCGKENRYSPCKQSSQTHFVAMSGIPYRDVLTTSIADWHSPLKISSLASFSLKFAVFETTIQSRQKVDNYDVKGSYCGDVWLFFTTVEAQCRSAGSLSTLASNMSPGPATHCVCLLVWCRIWRCSIVDYDIVCLPGSECGGCHFDTSERVFNQINYKDFF